MQFIKLLDTINDEWTIREKAKSLYRSIGKIIQYDERFAYSQNKELLEKIYYRNVSIEQDEDVNLVCRTANMIYLELLTRLDIKAELIKKKSTTKRPIQVDDYALVFYDEFNNKIYTNIIGDIENCKQGMQTEYFGITKNNYESAQDVTFISYEENILIDKKINELNLYYSNILFSLLNDEVKNTSNFKKFLFSIGIDASKLNRDTILKLKLHYITKYIKYDNKSSGITEIKKFYQKLFWLGIIDKTEEKRFKTYEFIKEEGENIEIISCLELNFKNESIYYIFSKEQGTYIKIDIENLKNLLEGFKEVKGKKLTLEK